MKERVVLTRWIILVLLLMISVTFMFLQILSLKAIDNTVCEKQNDKLNYGSALVQRYNCFGPSKVLAKLI